MSESGSDRSRHRHRHRRRPHVAFHGQIGPNVYGGPHYAADLYRDYDGPHLGFFHDDDRLHFERRDLERRDPSPSTSRASWIVDAMESLAAELQKCGYEPRKPSKVEMKTSETPAPTPTPTPPSTQRSEREKSAIDEMTTKMAKLEDAMRNVQGTLHNCLEKLKASQDAGAEEKPGDRSSGTKQRQRRYRSPDRWLYGIL